MRKNDMDEKKTLMVKKLGAGEARPVEITPDTTARRVLTMVGASQTMILTPAPQMGIVFDDSEVLWGEVVTGQTLFAGMPTPCGC
jgi:hypothetical protein